jgi:hypothetical protein
MFAKGRIENCREVKTQISKVAVLVKLALCNVGI